MKFTLSQYISLLYLVTEEIKHQKELLKKLQDKFFAQYPNGEFIGKGEPPTKYRLFEAKLDNKKDYISELLDIKNTFDNEKV